jgi:hypothetical protein
LSAIATCSSHERQAYFLSQRLRKLLDERLMLRVRLRQQFLEPFVFVLQVRCVHVFMMRIAAQIVPAYRKNLKKSDSQ